ncbi:hypothetical protein HDU96_002802 [Phlyctochytrium bullatum]|nr:hypothetical protein HDU96_002802 [Phlyctochytrium bullatum]
MFSEIDELVEKKLQYGLEYADDEDAQGGDSALRGLEDDDEELNDETFGDIGDIGTDFDFTGGRAASAPGAAGLTDQDDSKSSFNGMKPTSFDSASKSIPSALSRSGGAPLTVEELEHQMRQMLLLNGPAPNAALQQQESAGSYKGNHQHYTDSAGDGRPVPRPDVPEHYGPMIPGSAGRRLEGTPPFGYAVPPAVFGPPMGTPPMANLMMGDGGQKGFIPPPQSLTGPLPMVPFGPPQHTGPNTSPRFNNRNSNRGGNANVLAVEHMKRKGPPAEDQVQDWKGQVQEHVSRIWKELHLSEPIPFTEQHPFLYFLSFAKGKKVIPRIIGLLAPEQILALLTTVFARAESLDVCNMPAGSIDEHVDLFVVNVIPCLVAFVSEVPLHVVNACMRILLERHNMVWLAKSKVGLAFLTLLLSRAEILKQGGGLSQGLDPPSQEDLNLWSELYNFLFASLHTHFASIFPPTPPDPMMSPPDEVYVWQFLAAMAVGATTVDHQRVLVTEVRTKVIETSRRSQMRRDDANITRSLANVNLFLNALGLGITAEQLAAMQRFHTHWITDADLIYVQKIQNSLAELNVVKETAIRAENYILADQTRQKMLALQLQLVKMEHQLNADIIVNAITCWQNSLADSISQRLENLAGYRKVRFSSKEMSLLIPNNYFDSFIRSLLLILPHEVPDIPKSPYGWESLARRIDGLAKQPAEVIDVVRFTVTGAILDALLKISNMLNTSNLKRDTHELFLRHAFFYIRGASTRRPGVDIENKLFEEVMLRWSIIIGDLAVVEPYGEESPEIITDRMKYLADVIFIKRKGTLPSEYLDTCVDILVQMGAHNLLANATVEFEPKIAAVYGLCDQFANISISGMTSSVFEPAAFPAKFGATETVKTQQKSLRTNATLLRSEASGFQRPQENLYNAAHNEDDILTMLSDAIDKASLKSPGGSGIPDTIPSQLQSGAARMKLFEPAADNTEGHHGVNDLPRNALDAVAEGSSVHSTGNVLPYGQNLRGNKGTKTAVQGLAAFERKVKEANDKVRKAVAGCMCDLIQFWSNEAEIQPTISPLYDRDRVQRISCKLDAAMLIMLARPNPRIRLACLKILADFYSIAENLAPHANGPGFLPLHAILIRTEALISRSAMYAFMERDLHGQALVPRVTAGLTLLSIMEVASSDFGILFRFYLGELSRQFAAAGRAKALRHSSKFLRKLAIPLMTSVNAVDAAFVATYSSYCVLLMSLGAVPDKSEEQYTLEPQISADYLLFNHFKDFLGPILNSDNDWEINAVISSAYFVHHGIAQLFVVNLWKWFTETRVTDIAREALDDIENSGLIWDSGARRSVFLILREWNSAIDVINSSVSVSSFAVEEEKLAAYRLRFSACIGLAAEALLSLGDMNDGVPFPPETLSWMATLEAKGFKVFTPELLVTYENVLGTALAHSYGGKGIPFAFTNAIFEQILPRVVETSRHFLQGYENSLTGLEDYILNTHALPAKDQDLTKSTDEAILMHPVLNDEVADKLRLNIGSLIFFGKTDPSLVLFSRNL